MATTALAQAGGSQFTDVKPEAAQTPTTRLSSATAQPDVGPEGAGTPTTDLHTLPIPKTQI